jgi:3',5'-cyclic AMP phosphodiesterase CpdA
VKTHDPHLGAIFISGADHDARFPPQQENRPMRLGLAKALGAAGALITAAIVGGTLIGSALAVDEDAPTVSAAGAHCETFMDTFAAELGTTRDGLVAAGQVAANAAIDAAVAAGDLTEERAAAMRERVAEYDGEGCHWFGPGHRGGPGRGAADFVRGFVGAGKFDAAAEALGLNEAELMAGLREAGGLEALAEAQGASYDEVTAAVLADVETDLDAAVTAGNLTQERADAVLERVTNWLDEGGELRGARHPHGMRDGGG